jgi:hypothetical protein
VKIFLLVQEKLTEKDWKTRKKKNTKEKNENETSPCLRASPVVLSMWPCKNISHIQVLVTYFFPTPPIKLKLGLQIDGSLLIATHLDKSNYLASQKQGSVNKYDLTVFIRLFQGSESCAFFQGLPVNPLDFWLLYLIKDFQCRVTSWVPVEML